MKKRVSFITLGCKVNQYETNAMMQKFQENGYEIVEIDNVSDICVVNTCTVTNMSDRKSRQALRKVKDKNKDAIIVATGCYAQSSKEELEKMPEIDVVLGNEEKRDIVKYVEKYFEQNQKLTAVQDISVQKEFEDMGQISYTEKIRAVIKVQDGCNQFCSYCIIPYARGRVRSRKIDSIIKEIEQIAQKGIKEVVITGIHLASYGKDFEENIGLIDLLEEINKIDGIVRIRLGSLEPKIITEEFMQRLIKLEKICHHFHLSLQSGCDNTLKRMNRKTNKEQIESIISNIRNKIPNVVLRTSLIVGFPGETDDDFRELEEFVEKTKFDKLGTFMYSKEEGTPAARLPEQIHGNTKKSRYNKIMSIQQKVSNENLKNKIGKNVEVLIEDISFDGKYLIGRTSQDVPEEDGIIYVENNNFESKVNSFVNVKVTEVKEYDLIGKIV